MYCEGIKHGVQPPQVDRHINIYCTPILAFEVERMIEKGWVGVRIGQIVATRLSDRGQHSRSHIEVAINFVKREPAISLDRVASLLPYCTTIPLVT